jgi:hypothetical protein
MSGRPVTRNDPSRLQTAQEYRGDADGVEDRGEEYANNEDDNENRNSTESSTSRPSQEARHLGFFYWKTDLARTDGKNPSLNTTRTRE